MGMFIYLVIVSISLIYFYLRNKFNYFQNRGIICDPPTLLLGNLNGIGTKIHISQYLKSIYEKFKFDNKVCGFYLLHQATLVVLDLDLIKDILIRDFRSFADRGVYNDEVNDPLSAHLFAIDGKFVKF